MSTLAALLLAISVRAEGPPLELEWCTGNMPASWGFAITPSEACRAIHVRALSGAVLVTSARPGPSMPEGWTLGLVDGKEVVASGPTELPAGVRLETLLLIETNRSTGAIDARGALPVEWEIWFADAEGTPTMSGRMTAAFPPVLPLEVAAGRGMVLVTHEGIGPAGPIELTVDNPTWFPLWLDVPTGTVLAAEGREWIVASCAPFRMMRKQKTGRTVTAFPLLPHASTTTPRRLNWKRTSSPEHVARATWLSVAAGRVQDESRSGARPPGGAFERANPWAFWPTALRWATWTATAAPERQVLLAQVAQLIAESARTGDATSGALDSEAATSEVEAAARAISEEADRLAESPLPLDLLAAKERFR